MSERRPRQTFALIPAAGSSRRMGRPKLLLPLGEDTVLGRVLATLRRAQVGPVLVVVGPHLPELATVAGQAGASVCQLSEGTADMRATVLEGLRWLEDHFAPRPEDDWLLLPADHPTLEADVVRQLLRSARQRPDCSIRIPTFEGRRGHPALIGWKHVSGIRVLPPGQGINAYLRLQARETLELPVTSATVLWDLDEPADYERLRLQFGVGG